MKDYDRKWARWAQYALWRAGAEWCHSYNQEKLAALLRAHGLAP